jgi:hypothetical protein
MLKYLDNRKCPKCLCDFVVVLLDRSSRVQSINGFCGSCDHRINWRLIRKKTSLDRLKKPKEKVSLNGVRL